MQYSLVHEIIEAANC